MVTMVELQSCSLALHCVTTCILKLKIGQKFSCMIINFNLQAHGTRPTQESFFLLPTNFVFLSLSVQGAAPACRALRPLESPRSVPTFISRFASMAVPFKFRRKDKYKYTKMQSSGFQISSNCAVVVKTVYGGSSHPLTQHFAQKPISSFQ